jgi:hypothetical protein
MHRLAIILHAEWQISFGKMLKNAPIPELEAFMTLMHFAVERANF